MELRNFQIAPFKVASGLILAKQGDQPNEQQWLALPSDSIKKMLRFTEEGNIKVHLMLSVMPLDTTAEFEINPSVLSLEGDIERAALMAMYAQTCMTLVESWFSSTHGGGDEPSHN